MTDIDKILAQRATTHGDYTEHSDCTQSIMAVLAKHRRWGDLTPDQRETLHMIAHKMGRVVTGEPNVADHWDDMAGYAKLSGDRVRTRLEAPSVQITDTETAAMRAYRPGTRQAKAEYPSGHGYNPEMDV